MSKLQEYMNLDEDDLNNCLIVKEVCLNNNLEFCGIMLYDTEGERINNIRCDNVDKFDYLTTDELKQLVNSKLIDKTINLQLRNLLISKEYNPNKDEYTFNMGYSLDRFDTNFSDKLAIYITMAPGLVHPLEEKYGENGLLLKKIFYHSRSRISKAEDPNLKYKEKMNDTYVLNDYKYESDLSFIVSRVVFDVTKLDSNGRYIKVGELELAANELSRYLLILDKSTPFATLSSLKYFSFSNGLVVFNINNGYYNNKCWIEFISTSSYPLIEQWVNKQRLAGAEVITNDFRLTHFYSNLKEVKVPEFLSINSGAFSDSSVERVILSSPETITSIFETTEFKNKYGANILIERAFDKGNLPLTNVEPNLLVREYIAKKMRKNKALFMQSKIEF